jgi:hypothetical protein
MFCMRAERLLHEGDGDAVRSPSARATVAEIHPITQPAADK